jgi:hypothetical protein
LIGPEALSKLPTELNRPAPEKLRISGGLISAILVEINHLQGLSEAQDEQGFRAVSAPKGG